MDWHIVNIWNIKFIFEMHYANEIQKTQMIIKFELLLQLFFSFSLSHFSECCLKESFKNWQVIVSQQECPFDIVFLTVGKPTPVF